ncbi:MAG: AEC family transporter [Elusimicrobia bacterium]|nr:AEC family transporter [Elusimicrobiota bacterium]
MILIINIIFPIFGVIGLGYLLKRKNFLTQESINVMNRLLYFFGLPALIFLSIVQFEFDKVFNLASVTGIIITTVLTCILAWACSGFIKINAQRGSFILGCFRTNMAYVGFPIITNLYGNLGLAKAAIIGGAFAIVAVILSVIILEYYRPQGKQEKNTLSLLKSIIYNPLIVSSVAGLIFAVLGIKLPSVFSKFLDLLSKMSLPMALLSVGASITFTSIVNNLNLQTIIIFVKLIFMPIIALMIYTFLIPTTLLDLKIGVLIIAMPTAVSSFVMVKEMEGDYDMMANTITLTAIASMFTLSFWLLILK